jgi:hypothetical protein
MIPLEQLIATYNSRGHHVKLSAPTPKLSVDLSLLP